MTITTPEDLDALPVGSYLLEEFEDGTRLHYARRYDGAWFCEAGVMSPFDTAVIVGALTVLYRPDLPTSAAPTVEQIADVILSYFHAPDYVRHKSWWLEPKKAAEAILALYPTCQPSREELVTAIAGLEWGSQHGGGDPSDEDIADAIVALLPGRSEAEVKAEALEEAATLIRKVSRGWHQRYWLGCQSAIGVVEKYAAALRGER